MPTAQTFRTTADSGVACVARDRLWLGGMTEKPRQDLLARAFALAVRVFKLYPRLAATSPAHAHVARQMLRSVTGIGALLEEGVVANSRRDMAAKYAISLRESRESNYWSRLVATDDKWAGELAPITKETSEFIAMLTVSVRKLRAPVESGQEAEGKGQCDHDDHKPTAGARNVKRKT